MLFYLTEAIVKDRERERDQLMEMNRLLSSIESKQPKPSRLQAIRTSTGLYLVRLGTRLQGQPPTETAALVVPDCH